MKNLIGVNHLLLFAAAVFSAVTVWLWSVCAEAVGVWNPIRLWGEVQLQLQFPASYRGFSRLKGLQLIIRHAGGVQAVELFQLLVLSLAAAAVYLLLAGIIRLCSTAVANARADKQMQALEKLEQEAKELARADMAQLNEQTEKLAALTEDIENLSPTSPDAHIRADYPELQGISHAVNDLMQRMNESYRQQVQFVSDASHELRTPIAVIKGYADMLDRWGTEDESVLREGIAAIKNETDNMNRLVEQLLFLARGDSGRTQLQLQTVSLTDLMR
ncbi:MAG: HAMP domain-containing histidine kinase, partial [Oscillospiraceae bacterium]|nr:HAMP domain-containing histidine kinase [Oscillospiraceae bacterium]